MGHQWSAQTQAVKEFLARNAVPYRHLTLDEPAARQLLGAAGLDDTVGLPVVFLPDGQVLISPAIRQVAEQVGLSTTAGSHLIVDHCSERHPGIVEPG